MNIKLYRTDDTGGSGVLIFCEALDLFCVRTRLIKFFASVRDEQRDWINELRRWLITPPFIQALSERVMTVWCATHHQLLVETKRRKLDPILWLAGGENNLEGGARITTILDLSNLFCGHQLRLTRSLAPSMGFPGIYVCISTLLVPAAHTHAAALPAGRFPRPLIKTHNWKRRSIFRLTCREVQPPLEFLIISLVKMHFFPQPTLRALLFFNQSGLKWEGAFYLENISTSKF